MGFALLMVCQCAGVIEMTKNGLKLQLKKN
jgi:hypothetical protein